MYILFTFFFFVKVPIYCIALLVTGHFNLNSIIQSIFIILNLAAFNTLWKQSFFLHEHFSWGTFKGQHRQRLQATYNCYECTYILAIAFILMHQHGELEEIYAQRIHQCFRSIQIRHRTMLDVDPYRKLNIKSLTINKYNHIKSIK